MELYEGARCINDWKLVGSRRLTVCLFVPMVAYPVQHGHRSASQTDKHGLIITGGGNAWNILTGLELSSILIWVMALQVDLARVHRRSP